MSDTTTAGIRVQVNPAYWDEQSRPDDGRYAFTYAVTISNVGTEVAQLLSRHWIITDKHGQVEEVRGEGVVGKTPRLEPGERFEYTSWAAIKTEFGSMKGSYRFVREDGSKFDVEIGEFALVYPEAMH